MQLPSYTIIIPALNEEKRLPMCLESILQIDYPRTSVEIIVVDNGSMDHTRAIAEAYGCTVLRYDQITVAGLRNRGAEEAQNDILLFIDADCTVSGDLLRVAAPYSSAKDISVWGAPPSIPAEASWVQRAWYVIRRKKDEIQAVEWLESMNLFVPREKFAEIGGFDEALVTCEDVDFCYRASKTGKVIADSRLKVVHWGEAATLRIFFKKEYWRASSSIEGALRHGLRLGEMASLILPFYFGVFLPMLGIYGIAMADGAVVAVAGALSGTPAAILIWKNRSKLVQLHQIPGLFVVLQVYFTARTLAAYRETLGLIGKVSREEMSA